MDVIKIATAGSVDDGKSTLIGRLLYDTQSIPDDKLATIERISKQRGYDYLDFSLATDGLVAEREQGITIDVAHIYFSTRNKSYIIADTPGHIEYTRNMVTGASTSEVAVVLIDARNGVIEQTSRHFFINDLLRVKHVIVAINKMDLVNFSEERYLQIKADFQKLIDKQSFKNQNITFVPISALHGDNVVSHSARIPWYKGESILESFEHINRDEDKSQKDSRFQVQFVNRPKTEDFHDFRGYSGKVKSGDFNVGDTIRVFPSGQTSTIQDIYFYKESRKQATEGESITLTLKDDIQLGRGDMIVKLDHLPTSSNQFSSTICWTDKAPLKRSQKYIVQHGVHKVLGKIQAINHLIKPDFSEPIKAVETVNMNDMVSVDLKVNKPIFYDAYQDNSANGSFILIDPTTNNTVGVGFIDAPPVI